MKCVSGYNRLVVEIMGILLLSLGIEPKTPAALVFFTFFILLVFKRIFIGTKRFSSMFTWHLWIFPSSCDIIVLIVVCVISIYGIIMHACLLIDYTQTNCVIINLDMHKGNAKNELVDQKHSREIKHTQLDRCASIVLQKKAPTIAIFNCSNRSIDIWRIARWR